MRLPVVLFDLDGTVIDSGPIIHASFRHATRSVLARELADEELLSVVGSAAGLEQQLARVDAARVADLLSSYREHNERLHAELQACAGIVPALETLHDEGRRLGIVTAKRRVTLDLALSVLPLAHLFEVLVGSDDTVGQKPDPEPILHALALLDANPAEAAYVGDAPFDIAAGKAARVRTIGVAWGGMYARARLEEQEPDAIVETPEELLAALA
ncbi:MAG: HAD-IA family hydrolase [Gaiellaceae bacterium]